MIRINVLQEEALPTPGELVTVGLSPGYHAAIFLGSLLAVLAAAGSMYWFWSRQISRASQDLAVERREATRLAAVQAENQRFQQRVKEVERRLETVRALQTRRQGPVALMGALGDMVNRTSGLYLLTVSAESGRLGIQGQADTVEAIVNFISVLRRSDSFTDVQFRQFFQDDQVKRMSFKFNLDCVYQPFATAQVPGQPGGLRKVSTAAPGSVPATVGR